MPWPSTTEFTDAIQNPGVCFRGNPDLVNSSVARYERGGRAGMPVVATGQFACVYKATAGNREVAVRCFTREVKDQQKRYSWLHEYLDAVLPASFVRFQYLEQGILVKGHWYPIVRMDWARGEPLNRFIQNNLGNSEAIADVARRWRGEVMAPLRGLSIAHNDLQHGNVMVEAAGRLHLVDYDGIFLPRFQGESSPETGHKNYQHPQRSAANYDDRIDNFPALVVYLSLLALRADRSLWDRFYNDDNLLLTQKDYADPQNSECFQVLKQSPDAQVRTLADRLEEYCALPVNQVPDLESALLGVPTPPPSRPPPASPGASAPTGGYRGLLRNQQQSGSPPPSAPAPTNSLVQCPKCGRNNDRGLIYCIHQDCIAPLSTAVKGCSTCRASLPSNARFCTQCGLAQNPANLPTGGVSAPRPSTPPRPAASAPSPAPKTCPNCRQRLPMSAIYCNRCGTVRT